MPGQKKAHASDTEQDKPPSTTASRRINVAVTADMMAAIELLVQNEGVTLTEAVRRLVGYGEVMYRSAKQDGDSIIFRSRDGREREVLII